MNADSLDKDSEDPSSQNQDDFGFDNDYDINVTVNNVNATSRDPSAELLGQSGPGDGATGR